MDYYVSNGLAIHLLFPILPLVTDDLVTGNAFDGYILV